MIVLSVWALPLAKLSAAVASLDQRRAKRPSPYALAGQGGWGLHQHPLLLMTLPPTVDVGFHWHWLRMHGMGEGFLVPVMPESASDSPE